MNISFSAVSTQPPMQLISLDQMRHCDLENFITTHQHAGARNHSLKTRNP